MSERDKWIKLLKEELAVSTIALMRAHVDKELDEKLTEHAEKFYNIITMHDAITGTIPEERPF